MDGGGTIPWMESVESSLERRPRECLEHILEAPRTDKIVGNDFEQLQAGPQG